MTVDLARVNGLIELFGTHHLAALRAEQRAAMSSTLFDLPRRSVLGWQFKYDHEPGFLREVAAVLTPEEVGRRMKAPGSRPYYLQLFLMLQDLLSTRQQRMLEQGLEGGDRFPEERLDDLAFVVDFWERTSRAYRNDDRLVPGEDRAQPILEADTLARVRDLLEPPVPERYASLRRLAATLELYCFVTHGEQRDGIFGHGPYVDGRGRVLFFKEFNDLRNDFLPWAQTETRNSHSSVVFAYECEDVAVRCDMFGGIVTEPLEYDDRVTRFAALVPDGDSLRPLAPAEVAEALECAEAATNEIYFRVVEWPPRYRVEYGAYLFANHTKPFLDLAGIDANARLARAAAETVDRYADAICAGPSAPAVVARWATTAGPLYFPVVA